jgi:alanyl-tRNA synthetase
VETIKLYERNAYQRSFTSRVISCTPKGTGWNVELEETCFFPEGGGQPWDTGILGDAQVLEVHQKGGQIFHLTDKPLPVGDTVTGEINWDRRFDLTQQHSGEHIVSGLIHSRFGYENVGFHLGTDVVTVDWNGSMTWEQVKEIEWAANQVIWENRETEIFVPTPEELAELNYRSKKELEGDMRIVRFPGADTCACCGTHVSRAGEVGLIRILSAQKFRDGVRCEMVSGCRALAYDRMVGEENHQISVLLSAKEGETAQAVQKLQAQAEALRIRLAALETERNAHMAQAYAGKGNCLLLEEGLDPNGVRRLAAAVMETCGGVCAVFSQKPEGGFCYCLGEENGDVRSLVKELNTALQGRGGGKPFFAQGAVSCSREELQNFFRQKGYGME